MTAISVIESMENSLQEYVRNNLVIGVDKDGAINCLRLRGFTDGEDDAMPEQDANYKEIKQVAVWFADTQLLVKLCVREDLQGKKPSTDSAWYKV